MVSERKRETNRIWREKNKERIRATWLAWAAKNQEHLTIRNRSRSPVSKKEDYDRWYARKREEWLVKRRAKYAANLEAERLRGRMWDQAHKCERKEKDFRRRARKLGTTTGPIDYDLIMAEAGGRCGICGENLTPPVHIDHIIPLAKGGTHTQDNLQASHAFCNLSKGAQLPGEMRRCG